MKRALYIILLLINILSAVLILLSYLSTLISPGKIWILAFFGLFYPYFLVMNFFFIIFWAIHFKKALFISVCAILIGWNHLTDYLPFSIFSSNERNREPIHENHPELRLISYNVRAFKLQDWTDDPQMKNNILNLIRSEQPDVICLQEYYTDNINTRFPDLVNNILKDTPYHHINYSFTNAANTGYGMATFSRYPIIGKGSFHFSKTANMAIFTDIVVNTDTFRIYNNHLQSIQLQKRNYDFIDSLRFRYDEKQIEEIRDIARRLKNAFIKRSIQVDSLSAYIKKSEYPVIVCGDFNDTPVSYAYRKMRAGLKDAFVNSGTGIGNTYLGVFPSFRIDFIFHSPEFNAVSFERVKAKLSDHYPIICHLRYIR